MKYFILYVCIFNLGCTSTLKDDWDYRPSNTSDKVLNEHSKKYVEKVGGKVCSTGGGGVDGFNGISIGYFIKNNLTIDQARRKIIEGLHNLHVMVNNSEELRPYLALYPFPLEQMEYQVQVSVGYGTLPRFPDGLNEKKEISYAYYADSKIYYLIDLNEKDLPVNIHSETYEEALQILLNEDEKLICK